MAVLGYELAITIIIIMNFLQNMRTVQNQKKITRYNSEQKKSHVPLYNILVESKTAQKKKKRRKK